MTIRPAVRKTVILVSSVVAVAYLLYRGFFTLNLTTSYAVFASLFLYVGEVYGVMNMLLYFVQVWDTHEPAQKPPLPGVRTVDVFVPTYNEDPDLLRMTLQACQRLDYPHKRIYLCDDGKRPAAEALAKELGVTYMIRPDNRHAKAGNLNHAFAKTDGEFIIIFDADHVPDPHFITRLIGYFDDEKLGFVQTPHAFYNFESFQARLNHDRASYWEEGQLFYHVIQPGRNHWNAPIFAGSAAIFRRKALEEVGYIAVETITEDMHTGLRMHSKGWKSLGISERMISGQAAQDVTTFHSQRLRWGEGNLSVLAHDNPLTMRGLTWGQRLCYFATMINWCGGVFKLPIYLTPLLMLFTGIPPVREFNWTLAVLMIAYMLCAILGVKYASNGYGSVWYSELFTMASFWTQVRATMRAIFWRKFQQFIVTKKRGRQAKSIWPFVRPQLVLIGVSILALVWAWTRIRVGISDDPFKPVLASFWACFHMLLAYLVVRRALWPDDRRFSTRHAVHLPVAYEYTDAAGARRRGLGVTADLNDLGVGFVAYEKLPEGAVVGITLYGAGETIECPAAIKTGRPLTSEPAGGAAGYRYGAAFVEPTVAQKDGLNDLCLHYAVPRLYAFYAHEHQRLDAALQGWAERLFRRRAAKRRGFHLPVFLTPKVGAPAVPAITEDLSARALAVVLPEEVAPGTECPFTLTTPLGEVKGTGRVLKSSLRRYGSRLFYLCVLEYGEFEEGARPRLDGLLNPEAGKRLRTVLTPTRLPMPVPVSRPLVVGAAAATLLIAAELGLFRWVYNDDFYLQSVASSDQPVGPDEAANIDRIYAATMKDSYPSTDRLVLLGRSLQRMDRGGELAEVTKLLGPRDRRNLDLQIALAYAYDQREEYDQAETEYQRLLTALEAGTFPEARREDLMAGAARCSVHAGRADLAAERYGRLLTRFPDYMAYRNEFAGVLLDAGKPEEAAQLYDDHAPDYEGRVLLVMIRTQAKDAAGAEREARALLKECPGDATAEGLLADVLNLRGDYRQARSIYERLLKTNTGDLKLAVQLAHTSLWAKNYQEALERFQAVADQGALDDADTLRKFPGLKRAYVSAAANAPDATAVGKATVLRLAERALADKENDAAYLGQLGWVLHRLEAFDQSSDVLQRALDLDPNDAGTRRQLAGVLVAMGRADDALKLLQGRENSLDAHVMMVDAYAAAKDYASAERECRELLKDRPDDRELRLRLANVLSWNKQYPQALETLEELVKADPQNPDYAVRLAEVRLWSGDRAGSLQSYEALLTADFDRPALWWGFVDAAAGAKTMTDGQIRVVLAVADKTRAGEHKSSRAVEAFRKQGKEMPEAAYLTRLAWVLHGQANDAVRADAVLDMALALQPHDPAARKELAGALAAAGRFADALKMYDGLALEWQDRLPLARIYAAAEDFDGAAKQCRLALDKQPLDKDAQHLLADVLSWSGSYSEAQELFGRLVKAFPDDKELRRRQAEVTLWSGDATRALTLFQTALKEDGDEPLLWRGFMEAAGRAEGLTPDQAAEARRIAGRPIVSEPDNIELLARVAWVQYHHLNDKEGGRKLARRAGGVASRDPAALTRLGWAMYQMSDKEEARKVLGRAVALKPRAPAARKELAGVLVAAQQFTAARGMFEELVKNDPKDANLQADLARATLWAGDPALAVTRLYGTLAADFDHPEWWPAYVDAAAAMTKGAMTREQLRLAVRVAGQPVPDSAPDKAAYLSRLGWVLHREGETALAADLLEKATALDPADPKTRRELAGVLTAVGKNEAGLRLYQGLTLDAEDRFQTVVLYAASRRFAEAEKQCRAILESKADDPRARQWLADVALWGNHFDAALKEYRRMLAADFEQPTLWPKYLEAASRVEALTEDETRTAVRIIDREADDAKDAVYLARMALVLRRHVEDKANLPALGAREIGLSASPLAPGPWLAAVAAVAERGRTTRATTLLGRAIAARPSDAAVLARLAWVIHQMDDPVQANSVLDEAVALRPEEPAVRRDVGDVLVATGRLADALPWFEELAAANPTDVELQGRLALVTVWSGDYVKGLDRLQKLLDADFQQPELWPTYVDAAAGAPTMSDAQTALAVRIAEEPTSLASCGMVSRPCHSGGTLFLSRLAWALLREGDRTKNTAWRAKADGLLDQALKSAPSDPAVRLELAGVLAAARRFADALPIYEDLARTFPADVELRIRLTEVLLWSGDHARALERAGDLLQTDFAQPRLWRVYVDAASGATPTAEQGVMALKIASQKLSFTGADEEAAYLSRLAWILVRDGDRDKSAGLPAAADALLDRAAALKPSDPKVRRELAGVFGAAGRYDAGLRCYDGLTLETGDHLQRARLYAGAKKFDEARDECRAVLVQSPDNKPARLLLAQTMVWAGDADAALPTLEALLQDNFQQPDLWSNFVDAVSAAKHPTPAQVQLIARIAGQPIKGRAEPAAYLSRMAWVLLREGKAAKDDALMAQARVLLGQALALRPTAPAQRRELAGVLAAAGMNRQALEWMTGLEARDAGDHALLASLHAADKDFDAAEKEARRAADLAPDDPEIQYQLADVLSWNHKYDEAVKRFEALLRDHPDDARIPARLAETLVWSADYAGALERYSQLLAKDWRRPELWNGYVDAAASAQELPAAAHKQTLLRIADAVLDSPPKDAAFLARLGWVLRRLEEPKKGVALLTLALEQDPSARDVRTQLAEALSAAGDYAGAEKQYKILLRPSARP